MHACIGLIGAMRLDPCVAPLSSMCCVRTPHIPIAGAQVRIDVFSNPSHDPSSSSSSSSREYLTFTVKVPRFYPNQPPLVTCLGDHLSDQHRGRFQAIEQVRAMRCNGAMRCKWCKEDPMAQMTQCCY